MSVRGIHTDVTDMREKIFTEVARLAYEGGDYSRLEELPYKIVPGELASFRESVFTERAIVESVFDLRLDCQTVHSLSMHQWLMV